MFLVFHEFEMKYSAGVALSRCINNRNTALAFPSVPYPSSAFLSLPQPSLAFRSLP